MFVYLILSYHQKRVSLAWHKDQKQGETALLACMTISKPGAVTYRSLLLAGNLTATTRFEKVTAPVQEIVPDITSIKT